MKTDLELGALFASPVTWLFAYAVFSSLAVGLISSAYSLSTGYSCVLMTWQVAFSRMSDLRRSEMDVTVCLSPWESHFILSVVFSSLEVSH